LSTVIALVVAKLIRQVLGEFGIQLEEQQIGPGVHPPHNLAGVAAFAWAELGDHPRPAVVQLFGDLPDQRFRARDDRRDLHRPLKESLEKKCAHTKWTETGGADCN
jgi:hypothetical protein